ncbi:MAG: hypothetical protein KI792_02565 [Alphaproteobacteria bacterium]|nr:hypothetical protein [Alphaproteobacteria bacterium SS10]
MLFGTRNKARYEIQILSRGRWSQRENVAEQEHAIAKARALSQNDKTAEAIKVVQCTTEKSGAVSETEILLIDRPEAFRRAEFQVGAIDEVEPCATRDDLFKLDARRVMERQLRPYLGAEALTPTEFLHIATYHRQIEQQGSLVLAAAHTAARVRSKADGSVIAETKEQILNWGDEITEMAQDFAKNGKNLPKLSDTPFQDVAKAVNEAAPEGREGYWLTAAVCMDLTQHRAINDKLERLVALLSSSDTSGVSILDKLFADCILSPESLREMLGQQVSLLAQIELCLGILRGQFTGKTAMGGNFLQVISKLVAAGLCPDTAGALRLHMIRALASNTPLDSREPDPNPERGKLMRLTAAISDDPMIRPDWPKFQAQIDRRERRLVNDLESYG